MNGPMKHPVALALALCLSAPALQAANLPDSLVQAELLEGWRTPSGTYMTALHVVLAPGWKTYWRNPGEAGIAPVFDWAGSQNIADHAFHWPRPQVFDLSGFRTLGFHDELVLPIEIRPADSNTAVVVAARVDMGVCENICVPVTITVNARLDGNGADSPLIREALRKAPTNGAKIGIARPRCQVDLNRDGLRLTAEIDLKGSAQGDFAVIELADSSVWVSPVKTTISPNRLHQVSDLVAATAKPFALDRSSVVTTIFTGNGQVIELKGCSG